MKKIHLVLLAGGVGSRLWPVSRKTRPKQFIKFDGVNSLFQKTILRFSNSGRLGVEFFSPIIVTSANYEFFVKEQVEDVTDDEPKIILEPVSRNTAPAIFAATVQILETDPEAMILVVPTDHLIESTDTFISKIVLGLLPAEGGDFVCLGVVPDRPETGYGYMEASHFTLEGVAKVSKFHEKPTAQNAQEMLSSGNFYWNAGVFLFKAETLVKALECHETGLMEPVMLASKNAHITNNCIKLEEKNWNKAPDISMDYAILEKADNVSVVRYDGHWSDIGDWQGFYLEASKDDKGVAKSGSVASISSYNSLLFCNNPDMHLLGLDLQNLAVVIDGNAVLVTPLSSAQKVGKAISDMEKLGVAQAHSSTLEKRPWGLFEVLSDRETTKVKRLLIKPGKILSLQSHKYRSEHWVVVSGTATVTLEKETFELEEKDSIFIPQGAKHRVQNNALHDLEIIEVQTGSYFGEDDITRYEDAYGRCMELL